MKRFAATTRTAEDAAREIGTEVARIVKSLVFVSAGTPVVVLCSGRARVDEALLGLDLVWAAAGLPDAVFAIAPADLAQIAGAEVAAVAR